MAELRGNKAVEDAAIEYVMQCEREAGRVPSDTRYVGKPADVESPPRLIEVKAVGKPSGRSDGFLWLETRQVEAARDNADFYVYLVENVRQGDPASFTLRVFGGAQLQRVAGTRKRASLLRGSVARARVRLCSARPGVTGQRFTQRRARNRWGIRAATRGFTTQSSFPRHVALP